MNLTTIIILIKYIWLIARSLLLSSQIDKISKYECALSNSACQVLGMNRNVNKEREGDDSVAMGQLSRFTNPSLVRRAIALGHGLTAAGYERFIASVADVVQKELEEWWERLTSLRTAAPSEVITHLHNSHAKARAYINSNTVKL